jgi:hypothetical protein
MQALFSHALLAPDMTTTDNAGRFNIYRNNLRITLRNALRTTFPAIEKLVGEEYFSALALAFVELHPPRSAIMSDYGDCFPGFLAGLDPLRDYPYLPDVSRIEFARVQAYHAADAERFGLQDEASIIGALETPAKLHPSVATIFSEQPALSIWRSQMDLDDVEPESWGAETALVWRQDGLVAEILVHDSDSLLLDHFAKGGIFSTLLPANEDHQAAEALIARFIELAASGVIVPACPTSKGE